ncbi:MAG: type IV-A pilus assembly ATPase PilB [Cystobacterineae bacterium]|nr:type IV-A pilus assembly ATPase PilB [Cystobacterineae bacterium]
MSGRLGELLVRERMISLQQLRQAQEEQKRSGTKIASALIKTGAIEAARLTDFLSKQYGVPVVDLREIEVTPEIIKLVPFEIAKKHLVLPIGRSGASLIVAMSDPSNIYAADELKFLTGYNVEPVVTSEISIREALEHYYAEKGPSFDDILGEVMDVATTENPSEAEESIRSADEAPVVKLVNMILKEAISKRASDIHVEPYERDFRVRFRIDGVLYEVMKPPMQLRNAIISRLKIMAQLDISERRLPQDGRIKVRLSQGKEMDFRVSVCPTLFGEKVVLRLLDKSTLQLDMTKLGFEPEPLRWFREAIDRPYGMVLVTGPTGSGKTTTLYSALSALNEVGSNLCTAEDPVEFNFAGINQVQMHEDIGLSFAASLRSFLRQDPDIIMIGEIRDFETAEIGVKAALTGHLVLSTLHTNDAPGTVSRLLNMGVEPFLVTASLNLILAQRLCRKLCAACKRPVKIIDQERLIQAGVPYEKIQKFQLYEPAGCRECNERGYRGRVAVYEVMPFWDDLKTIVINGASAAELKQEAIRLGMQTLRSAGLNKVMEGVTTLEEVLANTAPDTYQQAAH